MIRIQENIPLAPLTTFRIGGPAKYFAVVKNEKELTEAIGMARERKWSVFVLGGGSNVLFCDAGFDGLVIKLENKDIVLRDRTLVAGAGASLASAVAFADAHGLAGLELLAGIPGTIGGAVRGNAGAFGVEVGSLVSKVSFLNTQSLKLFSVSSKECGFSYRQSIFKKQSHLLIVSVELSLASGNASELETIAQETIARREAKHPQHLLCAGSFFMNPSVTDKKLLREFERDTGTSPRNGVLPAGWIIDSVGLRGKKIGGAQVSSIHPNYIVNTGNATAEDVLILSGVIRQRVRTQLNIRLQEEVQMVGF